MITQSAQWADFALRASRPGHGNLGHPGGSKGKSVKLFFTLNKGARHTRTRISPFNTSAIAFATMCRMVAREPSNLMSQMRRGAVEYCVLALLRERDMYGFELTRALSTAGGLVASEGTVYPLLTRIRQEGLVETFWEASPQGPPRRYYRLTDDGRIALHAFQFQWRQFKDTVDMIMKGSD